MGSLCVVRCLIKYWRRFVVRCSKIAQIVSAQVIFIECTQVSCRCTVSESWSRRGSEGPNLRKSFWGGLERGREEKGAKTMLCWSSQWSWVETSNVASREKWLKVEVSADQVDCCQWWKAPLFWSWQKKTHSSFNLCKELKVSSTLSKGACLLTGIHVRIY